MAHGGVIGTAEKFDDARALIERLEPVPEFYTVFSADDEPNFDLDYDFHGAAS